MKKRSLSLLICIMLGLSLFLVSCGNPGGSVEDINSDNGSSGKPVYNEESEEDVSSEQSSEDTSAESDPQYSMGMNSEITDDFSSSGTTSAVEKTPVYVPEVTIYSDILTERSVKLEVNYLPQKPELPTGCEITSLTTVLNFHGYNVSKTDMADNYLTKSDTNKDFWSVFIGNPRYSSGFGWYAQPITDAANKYLTEQGSALTAYNYSGAEFEELLLEVECGRPVVIWGTLNMGKPYYSYKWTLDDGSTLQWITPEHCLVLIGYDLDRSVAIISDPMRGIVEYDLETVKSRYLALYSQCVVIR